MTDVNLLSDLALESTLAGIRAEQHRRTDPLPAGANNIGFTSPSASQKVGQGKFFLAGSGRLTLSVAGNIRALFSNPVGSGKTISIVRMAGFTTQTGYASILLNPTAGLPEGTPRPALNGVAGGGVPRVGVLLVDTNATTPMSGGVDTGIVLGMPGGARTSIDLPPIVLAAGVSLGINVPFAGAADATLSIYWIED